ncbi:hypothetical protein BHE74_00032953 [Ensete ventricosum]|nr:hypothetical protein BHE74_00032953 [Ensete ventricosum]RZS06773.1 hypothetical protein BHM03_00037490 [Ensete ventricosum]
MKLQLDDGPRSSLSIGPDSDDAVEPRQEFAKRFAKGIGKLAGNMPGDRRKKTIGLLDRPYPGNRATASSYRWVNRLYPRNWVAEPLRISG